MRRIRAGAALALLAVTVSVGASLGSSASGTTAATPPSSQSTDWNQWRGPARDGQASGDLLPAELPAALRRAWTTPVGVGHSSPVVVGDTVFLHTREAEEEVARALSLADGSVLWRRSYGAPYTMNSAARSHGPGPKSTPVVAAGRLFTFGITEVLSAFAAGSGELLWQREFADRYPETAPIYGSAMSPIVVGDTVVVHIGWDGAGALVAFDVASGEIRWENEEFTPGYASPILVTTADGPTLVTQSDKHIIAVDAASGATRWSIPFETDFQQNSVTPIVAGDRLVFSGLDRGVFAVAPGTPAAEIWRNDALPLYMSSPVLVGDRLFGMSHKRAGQFICLDAATGEPLWTSRGREGENASIIALGQRVAFLTDEARLVIVDAGAGGYEPLAEYEVAETPTWAHPAFTRAGVLVKDLEALALWSF